MTLLIAGHETTAAVLTWTMYLLAQHPEAVERIRAEVSGRKGRWCCCVPKQGLDCCLCASACKMPPCQQALAAC
jgi:cytochrome P450